MKNFLKQFGVACLGFLAAGAADYARADVVYNTVAGFDAATTNSTFIGFDGILPTSKSYANFTGTTLDGATFNSGTPGANVNLTGSAYYAPGFLYAADFLVSTNVGTGTVTLDVTFTNPTSALALDFGSLFDGTTTLTLSDGTSITNTGTPTRGDTEFLGFVTSTPITRSALAFVVADRKTVTAHRVLGVTACSIPSPRSV